MKRRNWLYPALAAIAIVVIGGVANRWVLSGRNFFVWDDYDWLRTATFHSFAQLFHLIPQAAYNDRPIGAMMIKALYQSFGLHQQWHHATLLALHLLNACLLFVILRQLLVALRVDERFRHLPALAAIIFVAWPTATFFVGWDAAIFDTLACTWSFAFLALYLAARNDRRFRWFDTAMLVILYLLAIRTKEMAVALPLEALTIEFAAAWRRGWRWPRLGRTDQIRLGGLLALMVGYLASLVYANLRHPLAVSITSPYYQSKNPLVMLKNAFRYLALYYNPTLSQFNYTGRLRYAILIGLPFVLLMMYGLMRLWRQRDPIILTLGALFVLNLAPVLPFLNTTHRLYLYIPAAWLAAMTVYAIIAGSSRLRRYPLLAEMVPVLLLGTALIVALRTPATRNMRSFWLQMGAENRTAITTLRSLPAPPHHTSIVIINIAPASQPLFPFMERYGTVEPFQIINHDPTLTGILRPELTADRVSELNCPACYVVDYNHGQLKLVQDPPQ